MTAINPTPEEISQGRVRLLDAVRALVSNYPEKPVTKETLMAMISGVNQMHASDFVRWLGAQLQEPPSPDLARLVITQQLSMLLCETMIALVLDRNTQWDADDLFFDQFMHRVALLAKSARPVAVVADNDGA